jgi:hypothetical protein
LADSSRKSALCWHSPSCLPLIHFHTL